MAQLRIEIDLNNDAFSGDYEYSELSRVLAGIVQKYIANDSPHWQNVHDINGNPVGKFKVDEEALPLFD